MHQDFGDLPARDGAIARIAGLASIALEEDEAVLVRAVVVEPAWAHDRVREPAGTDEPFGAPLPVVSFGAAVIGAGAVGHPDGCHQRDARLTRAERSQYVAHATIIDALGADLSGAVGPQCEHDGVDAVRYARERVGPCDIAGNHTRLSRKLTRLRGTAHQGVHAMALPNCLIDNETPDAAGRTDHQHCHAGNCHGDAVLFGFPVASLPPVSSSRARSPFRVRG